ncbi:MAG: hypothetical protein JXR40_07240 [Pontiellaceae bacterium]|nr:hypothetical protein [Pontiellaceae bacterium]
MSSYKYSRLILVCVSALFISTSMLALGVVRTVPIKHPRDYDPNHLEFEAMLIQGYFPSAPREPWHEKIVIVASESKHQELATVINQCMKKSGWEVNGVAPDTMQAMKQFVQDEVSCATMPEKGFECEDMYYFSGGDYNEKLEYDFSYGFAMKKGESEVYRWHKEDLDPLLNATEGGTNLVAKTTEKLLNPTKTDEFVISYAKQVMKETQKVDAPGPQSLDEARTFFVKHAKSPATPEYCCELGGYFWFSGGQKEPVYQCFTDGYAIKKGDSVIYAWRITDITAKMKRDIGMDETKSVMDPTNIPKYIKRKGVPEGLGREESSAEDQPEISDEYAAAEAAE